MNQKNEKKKNQVIQNVDSASSSATPTTSIGVNAYNCSGDASAVLFGGETTNGGEKKKKGDDLRLGSRNVAFFTFR